MGRDFRSSFASGFGPGFESGLFLVTLFCSVIGASWHVLYYYINSKRPRWSPTFVRHAHSCPSRPKSLSFGQPLPRRSAINVIEVSDRSFRERPAERRHALLPPLFSDHRESIDVGKVFDGELGILPHRCGFPSVKAGHIEQHAQLPVLSYESLELRHKVLVIRLYQLAADVNYEHLPAVFFIEFNGHFGLLCFDSGYHYLSPQKLRGCRPTVSRPLYL